MDMFFDGRNPGMGSGMGGGMRPMQRGTFASVTGTIVDIVPARMGNRRADGCMSFVTLEDMDGNTVNFVMTPAAFVVDFDTLTAGMSAAFWYRTDAPVPLIYPPQYNAVVAAQNKNERIVDVAFYNASLLNDTQTLQLNIDNSVQIRTTNNQMFQGSPANRNLVVVYATSTRSIPAQTTPQQIVVLCNSR